MIMARKKRKPGKAVFKEYNQEQGWLFPPNLNEMVPLNHLVRIINDFIDGLNIDHILKLYKGGGTSSYHPRLMLKLLIYAYTQQIYSSRKIAKAARENIYFMWLTGNNQPDFRTINNFRSSKLKVYIDELFYSVVEFLHEEDLINLDNYFVDGTKIEATANKYTWVWLRSTKKYKKQLEQKVKALLVEIDKENDDDNDKYGGSDLEEMGENSTITSEKIKEKIDEFENASSEDSENRELKKSLKTLSEDYYPRMKKYEEQLEIAGERNSYSKTDHDATFMRMKEDHMKNGQLKPAYNVQMGTENQFVIGYSIHQKPTDTTCLMPHLEKVKEHLGKYPERIIADAGYGSEENYAFLEKEKIDSYVKFNYFHQEQKRSFKKNPFHRENLKYDIKTDTYICPNNKRLHFVDENTRATRTGYESVEYIYECEDCTGCTMREQCHRSEYNRRIRIRPLLEYHKTNMRSKLKSTEGKKMRSQRPIEVESVFGHIKWNRGFKRFLLKGLDKVKIEWGLLSIAHNMLKLSSI
jgi:transposase